MREPTDTTPASRAFLVVVGGSHVLVDPRSQCLLVLDATAAALWNDLIAGRSPGTRQGMAFAERLIGRGLLPRLPTRSSPPDGNGPEPRILAEVPLQVAANTSDPNPFSADSGW